MRVCRWRLPPAGGAEGSLILTGGMSVGVKLSRIPLDKPDGLVYNSLKYRMGVRTMATQVVTMLGHSVARCARSSVNISDTWTKAVRLFAHCFFCYFSYYFILYLFYHNRVNRALGSAVFFMG